MTRSMMETDKKNCGRRLGSMRDARETFERRLPAPTMESQMNGNQENRNGNGQIAARQETLCPSDPKDLRVLQMLENCCRKNTRLTIGKMTVISRWIVLLKTPENVSKGSRRRLRSRASQCQGDVFPVRVFVRTTGQWMDSRKWRFEKKIGKETKATETIGRKEGNNGVCSDEQPLSCRSIAQLTNWDRVAISHSQKSAKEKE